MSTVYPTLIAIETSTDLASVALLRANQLSFLESQGSQTHSQTVPRLLQALLEQAKKVVANEVEQAKVKYKQAYESGDADALVSAQEELTSAKIKAERVNNFRPPVAKPEEPVVQPAPEVDSKARAWLSANPWFESNRRMKAVALEIHNELVESGVNPTSDEYYQRINSEVRQLFPDAFPSEKPVKKSVVAPATRSTAPKKIVLTQSQVNLAKRMGLTPEQYAREVAKLERTQNG